MTTSSPSPRPSSSAAFRPLRLTASEAVRVDDQADLPDPSSAYADARGAVRRFSPQRRPTRSSNASRSSGSTLSWALPKRSTHRTWPTTVSPSRRVSGRTPGWRVAGSITDRRAPPGPHRWHRWAAAGRTRPARRRSLPAWAGGSSVLSAPRRGRPRRPCPRGGEQAVVGPDEDRLALPDLDRHAATIGADARVDDGQDDARARGTERSGRGSGPRPARRGAGSRG